MPICRGANRNQGFGAETVLGTGFVREMGMRKLLLKLIEHLQKRLANQKDDPRDWEWIKGELDKLWVIEKIKLDRKDGVR